MDSVIAFELLADGSFRGGESELGFAFYPWGLVYFQEAFEHQEERADNGHSKLFNQDWYLISYNCRDIVG